MFGDRSRGDCWNIWVREGSRCLGHYGWLTAIDVAWTKVPFQLLHCTVGLVWGSRPKVEYVTFQVTAPALEVVLRFDIWILGFGLSILTYVLLGIGCLTLVFVSQIIQLIYFRWTRWFRIYHPLQFYLVLLTVMLYSKTVCRNSYRFIKMGNSYTISS